ncbi:MAG: alpha/beta hydrolase [bacterium]
MIKKILFWIVASILTFIPVTIVLLFAWRVYVKESYRGLTAMPTKGVESVETVTLGGMEQTVLLRGQLRSSPVLLYIGDAVWLPTLSVAREIGTNTGLEQRFIVAYWEQRETGISFSGKSKPEAMTVDQYVADARDLLRWLKKKYKQDKIYVMGNGWGSVIGLQLAAKYPEEISAYIGSGQIVDFRKNDDLAHQFATDHAVAAQDKSALQDILALGQPPYDDKKEQLLRKAVATYTTAKAEKTYGFITPAMNRIFFSTDYSFGNLFTVTRSNEYALKQLWNEKLYALNLATTVKKISVPVFFIHGKNDVVSFPQPLEEYFATLEAPAGKKITWLEQAGHYPEIEEPVELKNLIAHQVLPKPPLSP